MGQSGHEFGDRRDRHIDLTIRVRKREKERLELRRRDVDPAPEKAAEELSVALAAACPRVVEVPHRTGVREQRRHRSDPLDAPARGRVTEALLEPGASSLELPVDLRREPTQHREPRRGRGGHGRAPRTGRRQGR